MKFRAHEAFDLLMRQQFDTVVDIGCGAGEHTAEFRRRGKTVYPVDIVDTGVEDIHVGDFNNQVLPIVDAVWASHILEHQPNVNLFLVKCHQQLREGGWLAVTVPPLKHEIVGGHVTLWNAGLLLYNLVLAGFNCRDARVKQYGYNISVVVQKRHADLPDLAYDKGDIERLAEYLPLGCRKQGFNGNIKQLNWG